MKYIDPDGRLTSYSMSASGLTLLKKLEGCVKNEDGLLIPYNDMNGHATKGYGILLHFGALTPEDIENNPPQTEAQATADFSVKVQEYETIVNNRTTYTFPDGEMTVDELELSVTQADALISLTYNSPSTGRDVINAIRNGSTQEQIKTIWLGGYDADSGLGKRRAAEWQLYSEGTYAENPYE